MEVQRRREERDRRQGGPVADSMPRDGAAAAGGLGAAHDPAARERRQPRHPAAGCGLDVAAPRSRARCAPVARRRPFRAGRRGGVRHGNRDRGRRRGYGSGSAAPSRGPRAFPPITRRARRAGRASRPPGFPLEDAMDLTVAARTALLGMIDWLEARARALSPGRVLPVLCVRRPAPVPGRRRPVPARLRADPARRLRGGASLIVSRRRRSPRSRSRARAAPATRPRRSCQRGRAA